MLNHRYANIDDLTLYFDWVNDPEVRRQSYQTSVVSLKDHTNWFKQKLEDENCLMLVFLENGIAVGQVRIQKDNSNEAVIGIAIGSNFRGKGFAPVMLEEASRIFLEKNIGHSILAYIKEENTGSVKSFQRAGFKEREKIIYHKSPSFLLVKKAD